MHTREQIKRPRYSYDAQGRLVTTFPDGRVFVKTDKGYVRLDA